MSKILLIVLALFMTVGVSLATIDQPLRQDEVTQHPIIDKIINSRFAVAIGGGWYRAVRKENLSGTEFDWRFDIRVIETNGRDLIIVHRQEQNSGQHPDSNWVIEYSYMGNLADNTLNQYDKERFISVQGSDGGWFRVSVTWPDNFRYPDLLTEEEAAELYKKELEWWNNKL
jgi:hypothetical protein